MTADGGSPLRIVLADDHIVVRRGLEHVLGGDPGFEVVAQAGDIPSARATVRQHKPDVLVLDLNMPGGSVLETIPHLRTDSPDTRIVVLTMDQRPASVRAARKAGALGYVLKEAADEELAEAVRKVAAGEPYLTRGLASRLMTERMLEDPSD